MVMPTQRKPRYTVLLTLLLSAAALSGCVGDDGDVDGGDGTDSVGSGLAALGCPDEEGVVVAEIGAANGTATEIEGVEVKTWPFDLEMVAPVTFCVINSGIAEDGLMAMPQALDDMPQWVIDYLPPAVDDGHGGHVHGAAAPEPVFELTVPAGEARSTVIETTGGLMVHGTIDQSIMGTWTVLPNMTEEYELAVHKLKLYANGTGYADAGDSHDVTFDVKAPNLSRITGLVSWDDSEDDQDAGGGSTNKADTLQVEVVNPAGEVVEGSTKKKTARQDGIVIELAIPTTEWPSMVSGVGEADAQANITSVRPDDTTGVGTWSVRVTVIAAAGVTDDSTGSLNDASTDPGQSFNVEIQFYHEYGAVMGLGETVGEKIVEGLF